MDSPPAGAGNAGAPGGAGGAGGAPALDWRARRALGMLARGHALDAIARACSTSRAGVARSLERAVRALGARDVAAAIAEATRRGLIT